MKSIADTLGGHRRFVTLCLGFALVLATVGCSSSSGGGGGDSGGDTGGGGTTDTAATDLATWVAAAMVYTDFSSHLSSGFLDAGEVLADFPSKDAFSTSPSLLATTTEPISSLPATYSSISVPAGYYQVYTLTLAAAQKITFLTTSSSMDVTLDDSTKTRLRDLRDTDFADSAGNARLTLNLAAGTYYIVADNASSSTAATLTYLQVKDGTADSLTPIFPGLTDTRVALIPGSTTQYMVAGTLSDGTNTFSTADLLGPLVLESGAYVLYGNQRQHGTALYTGHDIDVDGGVTFDGYWIYFDGVQGKSITAATLEATGDLEIWSYTANAAVSGPQTLSCAASGGRTYCGGFATFTGQLRIKSTVTTAPSGTVTVVSTYPTGTETQTFTVAPAEFLTGGTVSTTVGTDTATLSWSGWPTSGLVAHGAEMCVGLSPSNCDYKQNGTVSASGTLTGTQTGAIGYEGIKWMDGVVAAEHFTEMFKYASDLIANGIGAFSLSGTRAGGPRNPMRRGNPLRRS